LAHLFEGSFGGDQIVDHVGRHTDEGGDSDAVAEHCGPERVEVVKQLHLGRECQETHNNELQA